MQTEGECKGVGEGERGMGLKGKMRVPPIGEGLICVSDSVSFHIKAEAYFWTTRLRRGRVIVTIQE